MANTSSKFDEEARITEEGARCPRTIQTQLILRGGNLSEWNQNKRHDTSSICSMDENSFMVCSSNLRNMDWEKMPPNLFTTFRSCESRESRL